MAWPCIPQQRTAAHDRAWGNHQLGMVPSALHEEVWWSDSACEMSCRLHALSWPPGPVLLWLTLRTWTGRRSLRTSLTGVCGFGGLAAAGACELWESTHQLVSPIVPSAGLYQYGWGWCRWCNQALRANNILLLWLVGASVCPKAPPMGKIFRVDVGGRSAWAGGQVPHLNQRGITLPYYS